MKNYNEAVCQLYSEKENLIILGLTGRTGAGCSTVASILKKEFCDLEYEYNDERETSLKEKKEFEIIKSYIETDKRWEPFEVIEGSCVILSYIFEYQKDNKKGEEVFVEYLKFLQSDKNKDSFKIDNFRELENEIHGLNYIFEEIAKHPLSSIKDWETVSKEDIDIYYELYINKLAEYKNRVKKIFLKYSCYEEKKRKLQDDPPIKYHFYTYLLQKIANNIRASGNPYVSELHQDKILDFAKRIRIIIELIKKHKGGEKARICIDAIRNANESNYLRCISVLFFDVDKCGRKNETRQIGSIR